MKKRKFATDGFVNPASSFESYQSGLKTIDDGEEQDARNRNDAAEAMLQIDAVETPKVSAKPKVVTMEQLQAFKKQYGADKDLTDYMNKQQGLTRRGGSTPSTATSSANAYGKEQQYQRAQEAETSPAAKERRKAKEQAQALEASRPELDIAGGMAGASLKTIAKLAKGLANRGGAKTAAKRLERPDPTYTEKELELIKEIPRELPRRAKQLALPSPTKRIGYDKPMNKGGMVSKYASGGSVSSRADGIAQRGKTRGRMC